MNLFSRQDWKREARKAQRGEGGPGWMIASVFMVLAILITWLKSCGG